MAKANKDMLIGDLLRLNEGIAPILMRAGMNCVGCPSARGESLEQACEVHGMEVDNIVEEINLFLQSA